MNGKVILEIDDYNKLQNDKRLLENSNSNYEKTLDKKNDTIDNLLDRINILNEYIINDIINDNIYYIENFDLQEILEDDFYGFKDTYNTLKELGIDKDRFKEALQDRYEEYTKIKQKQDEELKKVMEQTF